MTSIRGHAVVGGTRDYREANGLSGPLSVKLPINLSSSANGARQQRVGNLLENWTEIVPLISLATREMGKRGEEVE